jgi:6-pyruvoyltetrahydropterin/6-carboxytetrahydropterin synthase
MWLEDNWDHHFLVYEFDPLAKALQAIDPTVVVVPFNPTAENIAIHLVEVIGPQLLKDTGVTLVECIVDETRKCSASYAL